MIKTAKKQKRRIKGKITTDDEKFFDRRRKYPIYYLEFGRDRRKAIMSHVYKKGALRINCEGGLSRTDPDIKWLVKRNHLQFNRRFHSGFCGSGRNNYTIVELYTET